MKQLRCLALTILVYLLLALGNCNYEYCTSSSQGSCASGCCYSSSGFTYCQSSAYYCSYTYSDAYTDTYGAISTGVIVAISLSSICFVAILIGSIVCIVRAVRRNREQQEAIMFATNGGQATTVQLGDYGNQPYHTDPNMGSMGSMGNMNTPGNKKQGAKKNQKQDTMTYGNPSQNQLYHKNHPLNSEY